MPLLKLNKKRPYGEVFGEPGVGYQQDGRYFRPDGSLYGDPVEVGDDHNTSDRPTRGSREEDQWLRQQLAIYDQEYTTAAAARKFLAGKDTS